jgi:hypothetical protein
VVNVVETESGRIRVLLHKRSEAEHVNEKRGNVIVIRGSHDVHMLIHRRSGLGRFPRSYRDLKQRCVPNNQSALRDAFCLSGFAAAPHRNAGP